MSYKIVKIGVECVGQGLLMHNPAGMVSAGDEAAGPSRAGKKIPKPHDEAVTGLYVLPESNQLYASADWFREAALMAAKEFKDKARRGNATMVQRFSASVFQSELYFPLVTAEGKPVTNADDDWVMYLKRVVVQGNGIVRARPLITDWACTVEYEYDSEAITPAVIAPIMHTAGKFPGVGDYRPGKKGPFGRFKVVTVDGGAWEPAQPAQ